MGKGIDACKLTSIDLWVNQLRSIPSLTTSNSEELKSHLLDMMDHLKADGLDDEEAFWIASRRMGDISMLKNDFDELNVPVIQMRKIILGLSGILAYFLLYYIMILLSRLLLIELFYLNADPAKIVNYVVCFLVGYHFMFFFSTGYLYFFNKEIVPGIESLRIKPVHTYWLFAIIICLAVTNFHFRNIIIETFNEHLLYITHYRETVGYLSYSFPLTITVCFVLLYRKYFSITVSGKEQSGHLHPKRNRPEEDTITNSCADQFTEEYIKSKFSLQWEKLEKIGLDEEEALGVILKRQGVKFPNKEVINAVKPTESTMSPFLTILYGILIYFFLHFLQNSIARIIFTVLQHFKNDAISNIQHTWSFIIVFHLFFIFFATSVYLLNTNTIQKLKRLIIKPIHTKWLLFATISLAALNLCFFPISRNAIGQDIALKYKFENIFIISDYTLPLVAVICFLILFNKYYRKNILIG